MYAGPPLGVLFVTQGVAVVLAPCHNFFIRVTLGTSLGHARTIDGRLQVVDEPYPMAVLEAMAVGLPVVVTDSCGLAPEVTSIGCGMVVPGDDVDALVGAVRKLLSSSALRDEMGTRGRAEVHRRFGTAAVARTLEQHYEGEHSHV